MTSLYKVNTQICKVALLIQPLKSNIYVILLYNKNFQLKRVSHNKKDLNSAMLILTSILANIPDYLL